MTVHEFTSMKIVKLLGTKYRRTDQSSYNLTKIHEDIGKFMAYQIIDEFELSNIPIPHPLGVKEGYSVMNENQIILISILRAGLFYSNGIRSIFQDSEFHLVNPDRKIGLKGSEEDILDKINEKKIVIIIDSVINTGDTIIPVIDQVTKKNPKKIIVSTMVLPEKTVSILDSKYPNVLFYFFRSSQDQYVGTGATDTGNRLFGTFPKEN